MVCFVHVTKEDWQVNRVVILIIGDTNNATEGWGDYKGSGTERSIGRNLVSGKRNIVETKVGNSLQTNSKLQTFSSFWLYCISGVCCFSALSLLLLFLSGSSVCLFHNLCQNFYKPCDGMTEKMLLK